jgi:chaperone required for assembly of F1-ATPase
MLIYRRSSSLQIVGYADADWGGCKDTLKSTSGYVFTLSGGVISWKSRKQTARASSTTHKLHAEFVAMYEANGQAIWMKKFIPN